MPEEEGQQSQPAAVQRPPPPPLPVECPPPPQCIIFCDGSLVGKLPVMLFDRPVWKCKEAMETCDFLPKDNVVFSLCLGKFDIDAVLVFYNYVKLQPITNDEGGGDRVLVLSVEEMFPWQSSDRGREIHAVLAAGKIAYQFQMKDLRTKCEVWLRKEYSQRFPLMRFGTSSQEPAPGGKPEQSSNVEQPDDDEQSDDDEKSDDDKQSDDDVQTIVVPLQQLKLLKRADLNEMAK
ncbi:hypothetical protein MGU_05188 [Metarhizium guizhouense ARSEF 977]|uniref:Uncharacterized protein n=1 Tax=Metarhizium guizhouense (strain ARSEF 977) TaxID=1276136 RepID=A0A0B4GLD3_METGA|nr:hypothetical protein MGU_05188 [Metarhizium guizhouense ARSEF 977]